MVGHKKSLLVGALALSAFLLGACGPVEYISQVTRTASSDVAAARAAKADKWAPYYYTLAVEYLRKAREEASFADFQAANRFGRIAATAAKKARKAAVERAADPAKAKREMRPDGLSEDGGGALAPLEDKEPSDPDGTDEEPELKEKK